MILAAAIFWRFWEFGNRWVLNQDQARDAIIGLYALRNGVWPVVGSPSSAGPFNFGPWYDYIIMAWEKVIPTISGPWIGFAILSVVSVILYAKIGEILAGRKGRLIFGLIAALAVGQVENAPDMLNTVIVGVSGIAAVWAGLKLIKTNKWGWAVLTAAMVGMSISFHFQAMGTLSWLLALVVFNKVKIVKRIKWAAGMGIGLVLAFMPLIIFDLKRNGVWIKSVIEYYTVGVNKFYVPVRWLTEIRDFWPQLFGNVIIGSGSFGYVIVILGIVLTILLYKKKIKVDRFWGVVAVSLLIQVLLMRSYKGVRSREYMIGFHSLIILIMAGITLEYYKLNKFVGVFIMGAILILAGVKNWQNIYKNPSQANDIMSLESEIDKKIKGGVTIYQYQQSDMASLPLFYLYYFDNRIGDESKIWVCDASRYPCPEGAAISKNKYNVYLTDQNWDKLTAENIYERLMVNYGK